MTHRLPPQGAQRRRLLAFGAGAAGLMLAPALRAQPRLGRVAYGQGSIDPFFAAGYVALKQGYFSAGGLDVEYLNSQSGPRTNQLLAAGQIVFGATAATAAPALTLAGKPAALVFGFDRKLTYANVIVRREDFESGKVREIKDLAGKRMGATQPQSSTWLMAKYLTEKAGVADRVDIRPLGDLATMLGALKTGSVSASMATMSMMEQAQAEGWGVPIFDATADATWQSFMGGDVPGIAALALRDTIEKRPEVVQAFVSGLVKAQDWINANSAAAVTDLIYDDYLSAFAREAVQKTIGTYQQSVFLKDNIITPEAYGRMTAIMGDDRQFSNEELKKAPYDTCVDMRFVRRARGG
ncbi:ABC transporter substrate-binding protein [Bordetella genomosp. 1]|uniref:ABC transporter substrate-binding protein n=1 Tax=Bordetella genomosp. 1 TaxID=1395607 RepID=A0A261SSA3_9BORD|nr:ABC transporter substrate-binding protein [Bordetella genomosp. 1]MDQ8030392.1 ABC transporter substrate-binding protein [Bordetella sp.]OZI40264.1 ABC transporter substrate-binding protein [Bordetella genomosp. 1]